MEGDTLRDHLLLLWIADQNNTVGILFVTGWHNLIVIQSTVSCSSHLILLDLGSPGDLPLGPSCPIRGSLDFRGSRLRHPCCSQFLFGEACRLSAEVVCSSNSDRHCLQTHSRPVNVTYLLPTHSLACCIV